MSTHPNHVTAPQADPAIIALMAENAKLRAELNRAIAQTCGTEGGGMTDQGITIAMAALEGWTVITDLGYSVWTNGDKEICHDFNLPFYLTDANACLRVLERYGHWNCWRTPGAEPFYEVEIADKESTNLGGWGIAPTFCRAACEAILRAHGKWADSN
jgi:hypothetical protein